MQFNSIPAEHLEFRMRLIDGPQDLREQPIKKVTQNTNGDYELFLNETIVLARAEDKRKIAALDRELSSDPFYFANITNLDVSGGFTIEIVFFAFKPLLMGDVEIGVDEYVAERMGDIWNRRNQSINTRFQEQMKENFVYSLNGKGYYFIIAGAAVENDISLQGQPNQGDEQEELPADHRSLKTTKESSFCVVSNDARFVATEKDLPSGKTVYVATKLTRPSHSRDRAVRVVEGNLSFVDWTQAGQVQIMAKSQLANLVQESSSYLNIWDKFGSVEGEILLREAREFGSIEYSGVLENRDGTCTVSILKASSSALNDLYAGQVEELELVESIPSYLANPEMSFEDFSKEVAVSTWKPAQYYKVLSFDDSARAIVLDEEHLPESGTLILSLQGEITQIRRRNSARRSILEGRSANPQLGLLLEEKGQIARLRSQPKHVDALTASVKNKVFKNEPTTMQLKAIDVALNTPDIALIQGPPGTGKTTVIAAIVERLNEMSTKTGNEARGQILLTGFQHDAVENMIDRISINSLPVPKFGNRSNQADEFSLFENALNDWCERIVSGIHEKYPDLDHSKERRDIEILSVQYAKMPTRSLAIELMGKIAETSPRLVDESIIKRAQSLRRKLLVQDALSEGSADQALKYARSIRHTKTAFLDDGPDRSYDALEHLDAILKPDERDILTRASQWLVTDGVPDFLSDLESLKKSLLGRLSAPPEFRIEKSNQEVIDILTDCNASLKSASFTSKDKRLEALADFVSELENDYSSIIEAISDYSFAFAATCQQSAGTQMQRLKGIGTDSDNDGMEYDYVIVDEAARVSPRDLMIPLAQGKRIILVGDHRQLPHIIDDEVARQMESEYSGVKEADFLKKSMFEYLFTERLKDLELSDGIQRRVTLDKQFRMHPLLGNFISRNFYERFDAREHVESGLSAEAFKHNLPGTHGRPVGWINVPLSKGKHTRKGTSWIRQAEVKAIVDQLSIWMNSDEGKALSFGVISFYKEQANLIKRSLSSAGVDMGRVRVGTVDSFQGMEFDVVFLSMVRTIPKQALSTGSPLPADSNDPSIHRSETQGFAQGKTGIFDKMKSLFAKDPASGAPADQSAPFQMNSSSVIEDDDPNERRQAQRLFGHLCLYNRLNVSMSRQKKMLVVVGDSDLLGVGLAKKYVPGLVDFYSLCVSEGVML